MDAESAVKPFDTFPGSKIIDTDYKTARWLKTRNNVRVIKPLKISAIRRMRLERMFNFLDADGSGTIDKSEIERGLQIIDNSGLPYMIDSKGILKKFDEMDVDGSGEVGWEMFLHVMTLDLRGTEYFDYEEEAENKRARNDFAEFANLFEREVMLDQMYSRSGSVLKQYAVFAAMFNAQVFEDKEQDEAEAERLEEAAEEVKREKKLSRSRFKEAKHWLAKESRSVRPREVVEYNTRIKTTPQRHNIKDTQLLATIHTLIPHTIEEGPRKKTGPGRKGLPSHLIRGVNKFPKLDDLPLATIEQRRVQQRLSTAQRKQRPPTTSGSQKRPSTTGSAIARSRLSSRSYSDRDLTRGMPRGAYGVSSRPLQVSGGSYIISAKKKREEAAKAERLKRRLERASKPQNIGELGHHVLQQHIPSIGSP